MSKDDMLAANSAFAAFDRKRASSSGGRLRSPGSSSGPGRGPLLGGRPSGGRLSGGLGGFGAGSGINENSPDMIANTFSNLRGGSPTRMRGANFNTAPIVLESKVRERDTDSVVASSGIRLGSSTPDKNNLSRDSKYFTPQQETNQALFGAGTKNSHLKTIGSSNLRNMPSRVGQSRNSGKAQVKNNSGQDIQAEIRSSVVPSQEETEKKEQVITKTYRTRQEMDNEISAIYNTNGFLHDTQNVQVFGWGQLWPITLSYWYQ